MSTSAAEGANAPWYSAYPPPRHTITKTGPASVSREAVLQLLRDGGGKPGVDFLLVDLRRTDHEGGTIRGSLNLPAQSLYDSLPTLCDLCEKAGIARVIWYCGSSRGRGSRAAGWFADLLADRNITHIDSVILLDGVAGWAKAGDEYTQLMDGYDVAYWQKENSK